MELIAIACHHCGAPLQIPPQTDLVTCQHCLTQLAVRRNESVAWTEAFDELDERTGQLSEAADELADRMAHIEYERALERLDRRWESQRARFEQQYSKNPEVLGGFVSFFLLMILGIFGMALFGEGVLVGAIMCVLAPAVVICMWQWGASQEAEQRRVRQVYHRQRAELHKTYFGERPIEFDPAGDSVRFPDLPA